MIAELHSGLPYSVYEQTNRLNAFSPGQRSNLIGDPNLPTDRPRGQLVREWFNTAAFTFPGSGVLGNASKSPGIGPGFANFDTSLLKDFHVTEKQYVQFRSQFYNLFNRPNFANPNGSRGSATFGQISSTVSFRQACVRSVIYARGEVFSSSSRMRRNRSSSSAPITGLSSQSSSPSSSRRSSGS